MKILKKMLFTVLAFLLVFSTVAPSALGATNNVGVQDQATQEEPSQYWNSHKYDDVLYGNAWEKKYHITLVSTETGETITSEIPTVNGGEVSEDAFKEALPKNYELVEFKEEINPNVEKTTVTPYWVETAFDIGCFAISLFEFYENPSLWNGVAVIIDGGAVFLPFVPAVGGLTVNAIQSSPAMKQAVKFGIRPYKELTKYTANTGYDAHHIMPKKFASLYGLKGREDYMFCIGTLRATHQQLINKKFASRLPYGVENYTAAHVKAEAYNIYMELYYETGDYFFKFQADFIKVGQYAPR